MVRCSLDTCQAPFVLWAALCLLSGAAASAAPPSPVSQPSVSGCRESPQRSFADKLCEALPLAPRAPVAERPPRDACEACQVPLPPRAVTATGSPHQLDARVLRLVKTFVAGPDTQEERLRFAEGMLQLRIDRFFPRSVDLRTLRQEEAKTKQLRDRAPALRHLLAARKAVRDTHGLEVAVLPYFTDPEVRYSLVFRLAPDETQTCNVTGQNISVTRLAFQPLHEKIQRPLWQLRLENCRDSEWNHNFLCIESPLQDRRIPDPTHAVNQTFEEMMDVLAVILRLGWAPDKGDPLLLKHMQQGYYGVKRARSSFEAQMDKRAFSHLLWRLADASGRGEARVEDGIRVLVRMEEAGLAPDYQDFGSLMVIAVGEARHGEEGGWEGVEKVLDLMAHVQMPVQPWLYMVGFEALAWAARRRTAGLDEAEALLMRMFDSWPEHEQGCQEEEGERGQEPPMMQGRSLPCAYTQAGGVLQDPDLYASFLAVVAGAAHSGRRDAERMDVVYEQGVEGEVEARALGPGEKALTWHTHGEHLMRRMREAGVTGNGLVHHARLQVAVGSAMAGELGLEELEAVITALLGDDISLDHCHAHSLLAAVVLASECGQASLDQVNLVIEYISSASLERDALCYRYRVCVCVCVCVWVGVWVCGWVYVWRRCVGGCLNVRAHVCARARACIQKLDT